MNSQSDFQISFDSFTSKPVVVERSAAQISSDGGLLRFRELDQQLGLTEQFARALSDRRDIGHTFLDMTRMRIYGMLADYPDQNDRDVLRSDPIFKLICDRSIDVQDLASQPTLSRFENAIGTGCFFACVMCSSISSSPRSTSRRRDSPWTSTRWMIRRRASSN